MEPPFSCLPPAAIADDASGWRTISLPASLTLKEGTCWVSVQAQMDDQVGGQWFWETNTAATGMGATWKHPGDGFGTGCTNWGDLMFELRGKAK